ncbi:eif4-gamma eif5 eif2-epsilon [Ophiostoma piceae UAMH 11346]|uniref:Mannose-1-phosphate guanyltransferase n=1 Tax=Ophiostoma piceae (strain UAMH 11346) TaxID=1262450 RepID=S3CAW3_OPHP1|nr:eif4-gamma eif5 eif2-epsilon [Ophiostoma piceae UAMH 11346]
MSQAKKGAGARGKKAGGKGHADDKGEEVLQAVILADSFQDRFKPLTIDRPRCLLPLANTPLIEYTLEYLAMNGVQEVYLYCGAHADQIESYLAASPRWTASSKTNPFQSLDIIRVGQASSLGDFLRDLDKRGIIEGDFVLVHGDLVANVPLDPILARHRARREANRDAVMTMVLREAAGDHHTRAHGIEPLFVLDAANGRCLQYDEMSPLDHRADRYLDIDSAFLERNADIEVRADLVDCGIDICTPDVLALWTESFDCELPRKNFLHNVLKDWELNGKLIYTDIVSDDAATTALTSPTASAVGSYAARVTSLQMYDAISRDILGRWTYPLVPETNLVPGHSYTSVRRRRGRGGLSSTSYSAGAGVGVSAERGVTIDPTASVARAALGLHTSIGANSIVSGSTIGRRCRIGNNVRIENCYLWDDVVIGDNTVVTRSILASGVHVGTGCAVPAGSVLSYSVSVADNTKLVESAPGTPVVLTTVKPNGADAVDDAAIVGAGGKGAPYHHSFNDEDDDDDESDAGDVITPESLQRSLIYSTAHLNLSTSSISSFGSDADDYGNGAVFDDDDDDDGQNNGSSNNYLSAGDAGGSRSRLPSFTSLDGSRFSTSGGLAGTFGMRGAGGGAGAPGGGGAGLATGLIGSDGVGSSTFHTDAVNGLLDALRDDSSSDFESARLEFMGLRLSTDASDGAVRRAVAAAFARRALELATPLGVTSASMPGGSGQGLDASKAAERAVKSKTGAATFVGDVGVGSGTADEQVEFVLALQRTLVGLRIREEKEKERVPEADKDKDAKTAPAPGTLLAALLQQLYDNDVLEEEGILAWWTDKRAAEGGSGVSGDSSMAGTKERCRVLVEWLETADEDSDDDDDDDDDDESEDESDDE